MERRAGGSCGAGIVNPGNVLDGVSIVEGHELAEAITDPLLNAWYDANGSEIGDICAWTGLANINLNGSYFAMQPLWNMRFVMPLKSINLPPKSRSPSPLRIPGATLKPTLPGHSMFSKQPASRKTTRSCYSRLPIKSMARWSMSR